MFSISIYHKKYDFTCKYGLRDMDSYRGQHRYNKL